MKSKDSATIAPEKLEQLAEAALRTSGGDSQELLDLAADLDEHPSLVELAELVRRKELLERAWAQLREPGGDALELLALAKKLKQRSLFGAARRVLARARRADLTGVAATKQLLLIQQHALCTYKDTSMPAYRALEKALRILKDDADLRTTRDPETLGLAGAIYKRKWQTDGAKQHLENSLTYYLRGYAGDGTAGERSYPGINAAYVLDLLAYVENQQALEITGLPEPGIGARRSEARRIREEIINLLEPPLPDPQRLETDLDWWARATLAEAHFGLGPYDSEEQAAGEEGHYAQAQLWVRSGMTADGANLPKWELESTARQLAALAQLQVGNQLDQPAWEVIRQLVGPEHAEALVGAVFRGKLGIGLSGGGFRASLFHIGVFARLAELDLLRHVEVLSCVSGGSILGAYYYLKVRRLLEEKEDGKIERQDYIELVQQMARDFLAGVQDNLRTRVIGNLFSNLKMAVLRRYSRTDRLAELYEKHLYSLIGEEQKLTMDELGIRPKGLASFSPDQDNWRRNNKVPNLVLNATSLNTGHNWQFTTSFMGESAFAVDDEIDGNWLLRRMSYRDAPREHQKISLGRAVGASACVPGLFAPVALHDLYPKDAEQDPKMVVRLVDGGLHDNQGVVSLLEQSCSVIVVSDASGRMASDPDPGGGVLGPVLRMNSVLMERVRQSQFQGLKARLRAGLLKKLTIVHMKKAFDVEALDWRTCNEPPEESDDQATELLPYGVRKELQTLLAGSRTDLDSFSDAEAWALMASGYLMTRQYAADLKQSFDPENLTPAEGADWEFLQLLEPMAYTSESGLGASEGELAKKRFSWVKRNLAVAGKGAFRAFSLSRTLKFALYTIAAVLVSALWLSDLLPWAGLALLLPPLVLASKLGRGLLLAVFRPVLVVLAFAAAQLHLHTLDRLFLRLGRVPNPKTPPRDS